MKYILKILAFLIIIFSMIFITPTYAAVSDINYSVCDNKFTNPNYAQTYKDLYFSIHGNDKGGVSTNPLYVADCPPSLQDIEYIVIRIITVLITIVGLVVFFNLVRGSIFFITAGSDKEKIKKARGTFQSTFMGIAIILISYTLIIFIATRLGLAGDPDKFSILGDGSRLIFKFLFNY